jgi:GT2 family glycosyltransferase
MPPEDGRGRVSAVIITRDRSDVLGLVLDRLAELPVDEVIVVDNGSEDGTAEAVRSRGGNVRLLEAGGNLGVAGRNLGAREATGELLLMLDDDAYPLPGAVEALAAAFAANPRLGVAGGFVRDVDSDGNVLLSDELGTFDWWLRAGRTEAIPAEGAPAFSFPEGACMVRRQAYLEAGGFFEPFFVSSSEVDLAARLARRGWETRYVPAARFDHLKAPSGRGDAEAALYYRIRNHLWYLWLRFPPGAAATRTAGYLAFDLVESIHRRAPRAWARAVADAVRGWDDVKAERKPLPREARRRVELNRRRMHARFLAGQARRRLHREEDPPGAEPGS